jgi:hypothetical protein
MHGFMNVKYIMRSLIICTPHHTYNSCDQIERNEMGGACSTYGESRNVYRILVGKYEGKKPVGRPRHRWKNNMKISLEEVRLGGMDWIDVAKDRRGGGLLWMR